MIEKIHTNPKLALLLTATLSLSWTLPAWADTPSVYDRPNVLILLADDLGYGELGCYGQKEIKTPVLDELAAKGMRFTDFYAGSAVCAPSRAVLMTGISSSRVSIRGNRGGFSDDLWQRMALRKDELTLGEMLQAAGYQTGFIGKWHLADPDDLATWAHSRGFHFAQQEQWGDVKSLRTFVENEEGRMEYINGLDDAVFYDKRKWNCIDEFRTDSAMKYLDTLDKGRPFFLFMSYRAPHAHEKYIHNKDLYADKGWPENERIHAAKITLLDRQIGKLLQKLEDMGELENTLVLFTSDNGPHSTKALYPEGYHDHEFFDSNANLTGTKRDLYEGGIRVPLIAYWKDKIPAGVVSHHIAGFQDIMPTIAESVGIRAPRQTNGISMLPLLMGKTQEGHEFLNWEFQIDGWGRVIPKGGFYQAVRIGPWKGVRYGLSLSTELYNLELDASEKNDVAAQHPELIQKINDIFEKQRSDTEGFPYGGFIQNYRAVERHVHD